VQQGAPGRFGRPVHETQVWPAIPDFKSRVLRYHFAIAAKGGTMAYEAKLKEEPQTIDDFVASVSPPERQAEVLRLVQIFTQVTGYAPQVHSHGMVGFGTYAYTYDSGHSGTSFATGFAPRKADLSIYILPGYTNFAPILQRLGKHKLGKSCLYLKRLSDADEGVLAELIAAGLADLKTRWPVTPT
jgi:hypothetical protein